MRCFNLGLHDVVRFTGADSVRFLNGQLTQDVRQVADGSRRAAFSCVTDAKGRLQFRVVLVADDDGAIQVAVATGLGTALEARLTRYLISDDAEATLLPHPIEILHFLGTFAPSQPGILTRSLTRFGADGTDWWLPFGMAPTMPESARLADFQELEDLRIARRIPAWGNEITEGILPPEARLETSDISYQKGCYIGQEVISRIKSAGKVNRLLTRFELSGMDLVPGPILAMDDAEVGVCTSIASVNPNASTRFALGYLRRNAPTEGLRLGNTSLRVTNPA